MAALQIHGPRTTNHHSRLTHGAKSSHHRRSHGPRPKPPRRGHGSLGTPRRRAAYLHQEAGPHRGRHWQLGSEAAGRNAGGRKARQVSAGNCRNLPGHLQDRRKIPNRRLSPAPSRRGSFHRRRRGSRSGFAFPHAKKGNRIPLARRARRHEHSGVFALREHPWHAARGHHGLRRHRAR